MCGALDQAIQAGILAGYYLKGGVAMELRFAENARATKDIDIGMEGARADRLRCLTAALTAGFDEFTFRIKAQTRDMEQADTIRVEVAIQYRTRSWQTIEVDLGISPAHDLMMFVDSCSKTARATVLRSLALCIITRKELANENA